jgi:hypothetical protein
VRPRRKVRFARISDLTHPRSWRTFGPRRSGDRFSCPGCYSGDVAWVRLWLHLKPPRACPVWPGLRRRSRSRTLLTLGCKSALSS